MSGLRGIQHGDGICFGPRELLGGNPFSGEFSEPSLSLSKPQFL